MPSRAPWLALGLVAAVVLVAAGAVGEHYRERHAADPPSGSAAAPAALLSNCGRHKPVQRPPAVILRCDDPADSYLAHITWQQWGPSSAVGLATLQENLCVPDCASAGYTESTVEVVLDTPTGTVGHQQFTRLILLNPSDPQRPGQHRQQVYHPPPYPLGRQECQTSGCPPIGRLTDLSPGQ